MGTDRADTGRYANQTVVSKLKGTQRLVALTRHILLSLVDELGVTAGNEELVGRAHLVIGRIKFNVPNVRHRYSMRRLRIHGWEHLLVVAATARRRAKVGSVD